MYMYIASYHIIYVYNIIYVYIIYHNMYISMYVPPSLVGRCSWEEPRSCWLAWATSFLAAWKRSPWRMPRVSDY